MKLHLLLQTLFGIVVLAGSAEGLDGNSPCTIDCQICAESKITSKSHKGSLIEGKEEHTIHTDIVGPFRTQSEGGAKYFLSLIVGKLRFGRICLLHTRSTPVIQENILKFISWIERKTERKVQGVHSDGAKKFLACETALTKMGIDFETSPRYSPQSNGVAERFNRTILTRARSLMIQSNIPLSYWGEAVLHAVHLHNVTPTSTLNWSTPYEAVFKRIPNVSYLRTFGCLAIVHVPKQIQENKFSQRGRKHVLLSHSSRVYKTQDLATKEITTSTSVTFDETLFPLSQTVDNNAYNELFERVSEVSLTENSNDENSDSEVVQEDTETKLMLAVRSNSYSADEPTLKIALNSADASKWKEAINQELSMLMKTKCFKLVPRPKNSPVYPSKWF